MVYTFKCTIHKIYICSVINYALNGDGSNEWKRQQHNCRPGIQVFISQLIRPQMDNMTLSQPNNDIITHGGCEEDGACATIWPPCGSTVECVMGILLLWGCVVKFNLYLIFADDKVWIVRFYNTYLAYLICDRYCSVKKHSISMQRIMCLAHNF